MNSEDQFFVWCWKLITVMICTLIVSVTSCVSYQSNLVRDMVTHGADPIKSACAISSSTSSQGCLVSIMKGTP